MNDNQFNDIVEVLEDISDSLDSLDSSLRSIALFVWLPTIIAVGVGAVFVGMFVASRL